MRQLQEARGRSKKLRRASGVASFSGWSTEVFGILTLLFSLPGFSWVGILLGAGMCIIGWVEIKGSTGFLRMDLKTPKRLSINQLCFAALLIGYAGWNMYAAMSGPGALAQELQNNGLSQEQAAPYASLEKAMYVGVYGGVIVFSVIFQGSAALYYRSRQGVMREYASRTPGWILELQRRDGLI